MDKYKAGSIIQLRATGELYVILERCRLHERYNAPVGIHNDYALNREPDQESDYMKLLSPNGNIEYSIIWNTPSARSDEMDEDWYFLNG